MAKPRTPDAPTLKTVNVPVAAHLLEAGIGVNVPLRRGAFGRVEGLPPSPNQAADEADARAVDRAIALLRGVNWDFPALFKSGRRDGRLFDCRKYHWYPATFIAEIPYTLIEVLSEPGATVYDPFSGIGTTVVQAALQGRRPFGGENSRVTVGLVQALWTLLDPRTSLAEVARELQALPSGYDEARAYDVEALEETQVRVDALRPWFEPATFNALMYLAVAEARSTNSETRAALRVAGSSTLATVCAQHRGWGCIADNVRPKTEQLAKTRDVFATFARKAGTLIADVDAVHRRMSDDARAVFAAVSAEDAVICGDVRKGAAAPPASIDLVVTSPPYPSMTDYAYSQRLTYYWLGGDPTEDVATEIGARRKRTVPTAIADYVTAMREALGVIATTLKPGGYACFVLPRFDADLHNNVVRRHAVQESMASLLTHGLTEVATLERILPNRRRHHNQQWTALEREIIAVYRRPLKS